MVHKTEVRGVLRENGFPEGYYSRSEAAEQVGRHRDTLKRWANNGVFIPKFYVVRGGFQYSAYSAECIEEMKRIGSDLMKRDKPQRPLIGGK